jgi:hypothetical protein
MRRISRRAVGFLVLAVFIFFRTAKAQDENPILKFRGGIIAGMNASQVDGDNYAGYTKVGFNGGFISQIPISNFFFGSVELLYSQQGSRSHTVPGEPLAYKLKLNYAQIPVLINFQDKPSFNLGAGFAYGRLLRVREYVDQLEQPGEGFGKNDWEVMVGANYLFTPHFLLNARFAYSIVPIGHRASSQFKNGSMWNNLLTFRLAYII